jgi:ribosomal protein S18 acetylase RimI-like enzyme
MYFNKATEQDIGTVYDIINECSLWLAEQGMYHWKNYYTKEKVHEKVMSKEANTFLIFTPEPAGTVTLSIKAPDYFTTNPENINYTLKFKKPKDSAIYISALGVHPVFQNKGFAKSLMIFAEGYAKTNNIKYLRLDARGDYKKLLKFYKNLDYKIVGEMPDEPSSYVLFEKEL